MKQGVLDFEARPAKPEAPYSNHSTSKAAAKKLTAQTLNRLQGIVYAVIRYSSGLTDEEGQNVTGLEPHTYCPRRRELVKAGLIEASEQKQFTKTGNPAIVWIVTQTKRG